MNQTSATTTTAHGMITGLAGRAIHPGMLLNFGGPIAAYQILTGQGVSPAGALAAGAAFPLGTILVQVIRTRRLDFTGALSLTAIILGLGATLLFRDPHILLAKDSLITGALGLACLVSLLAPRPMMFVLGQQFSGLPRERFEALWQSAAYRAGSRRMTAIWGLALVAEAAARVALSFVLAPATLLTISPLLSIAVFAPLGILTWRRMSAGRARAMQAAA